MMNWKTTITITLHKAKIINVFTYYIITQTSNTYIKERIKVNDNETNQSSTQNNN